MNRRQQPSRRARRAAIVSSIVVAALCVAGCAAPGSGESDGPAVDDSLVIAIAQDIDTADTHNTTAISTEAALVNLQSYLVKRDDEGTLHPHLAESYELVSDSTWRFNLREGVTFHNGDALTSEDVKFSLERVALDDTLIQHANYNTIAEVNVIDDLSFEIVTHEPDPALPYRLAREAAGIFPKAYIEEVGWDGYENAPVGSGPYEFVEWVKGSHFQMKKYEDYFEGDIAQWETLEFRTISEASTRIGELLVGAVDIADQIPVVDRERIEEDNSTHLVQSPSTTVFMLYVNQNEEFLTSDPLVAEAIDYAIDDQQMNEIFAGGAGVPTRTRVVPGAFGADESLYDTYLYDVGRATELLAEAGYGPGEAEITLTASQGRTSNDAEMAQTVQGMLEAAGFTVNLDLQEASSYVDTRTTGKNKELLITGWNNTLFDASLPLSHFRSDYAPSTFGYDNPEVDALLDAAAVNLDEEERAAQYSQVQQIVAEDRPYIYMYQDTAVWGVSEGIDFAPRMDGMYYVQEITRE